MKVFFSRSSRLLITLFFGCLFYSSSSNLYSQSIFWESQLRAISLNESKKQIFQIKQMLKDPCLVDYYGSLSLDVEYVQYRSIRYGKYGQFSLDLYNSILTIFSKNKEIYKHTYKANAPEEFEFEVDILIQASEAKAYAQIHMTDICLNLLSKLDSNDLECFMAASKNVDLKTEACRRLDRLSKLENLCHNVLNNKYYKPEDRINALNSLDSIKYQNYFAQIIQEDNKFDNWIKLAALKRLNPNDWQDLFGEIVEKSKFTVFDEAPTYALVKLDSVKWEILLLNIAKDNWWSTNARLIAIERLNPQKWEAAFVEITKSQYLTSDNVKIAAIEKLNRILSEEDYYEIAKNTNSLAVKEAAVYKLNPDKSQEILSSIAKEGRWRDNIRIYCISQLDPTISQQDFAKISVFAVNENVRKTAIELLNVKQFQEYFAKIAKNEKDIAVRRNAIELLEPMQWQDLFEFIVQYECNYSVVEEALDKINSKGKLRKLSRTACSERARVAAKRRIQQL